MEQLSKTATAMLEHASLMQKYYAQAMRYLEERDRLEISTEAQIKHVAEAMRWEDFRKAVEPYERAKAKLLGDFFALQTSLATEIPEALQKALDSWNEMIQIEGRKFGYGKQPDSAGESHE